VTPDEYIKAARKFDNHYDDYIAEAAAFGLAAEAGEVVNEFERSMRKGRSLDEFKVRDELSDVLWSVARLMDHFGWTFEDIFDHNINKLEHRYAERGLSLRTD